MLAELEGLDFVSIARHLSFPGFEAYIHIAEVSERRARALLDTYSGDGEHEAPLWAAFAHRLCTFMANTILPGEAGTIRFLVSDPKFESLDEIVWI
jgi:N-acyl-D-amino-acid deacylase